MDDNLTPVVKIVTWFLLITSALSVAARGITKAAVVRSISLDDYLSSVSLVGPCQLSMSFENRAYHLTTALRHRTNDSGIPADDARLWEACSFFKPVTART